MTHDPLPDTDKPCLDDLLTTMGITRGQLTEMTADDLFAVATQWQNAATVAAAEPLRVVFPPDGLDSQQERPAGLGSQN